jgi:hypothetical protein
LQISAMQSADSKAFATMVEPTGTGDPALDGEALAVLETQSRERLKELEIAGRPRRERGALAVRGGDAVRVAEALSQLSGVANASVVKAVGQGMAEAAAAIVEAGERLVFPGEKFKVEVEVEEGVRLLWDSCPDVLTSPTPRLGAPHGLPKSITSRPPRAVKRAGRSEMSRMRSVMGFRYLPQGTNHDFARVKLPQSVRPLPDP